MIEVSVVDIFTIYIGITLIVLILAWFFYSVCRGKKRMVSFEKKMVVCEYCYFHYFKERQEKISRCPQCKSMNKIQE